MRTYGIFVLITLLSLAGCEPSQIKSEEEKKEKKLSFHTEMYPNCWFNEHTLQGDTVLSGNYASLTDSVNNFSFGYSEYFRNIGDRFPKNVTVGCAVNFSRTGLNPALVVSIDSLDKNKFWVSTDLKDSVHTANEWKEVHWFLSLPRKLYPDDRIRVYIWNKDKFPIYIDDFSLEFGF